MTLINLTGIQMAARFASPSQFATGEAGASNSPDAHAAPAILSAAGLDMELHSSFSAAASTWQPFEKQAIGMPYQTLAWVRAWEASAGQTQGVIPFLLLARENGKLVFALPLGLEQRAGYKALTFLGQENTNQNTGLWDPDYYARATVEDLTAVLKKVCPLIGADLVHFANIPLVWENREPPLLAGETTESPSPVFIGKITDEFDTLFREHFGKGSAKTLLKKQRKLEAAGDFRIKQADTPDEIRRALSTFFDQRAKREAETGIPSGFTASEKQAFLETLSSSDQTGPEGHPLLSVWFLEADGAIRATYTTVRHGNRLIAYSTSIAQDELTAQSPGVVLLKGLVEAACKDPEIEILDLGLGDESYKHRWSEPELLNDSFLACSFKGRLALAALKIRQELKTRIRNSGKLWPMVRKIRHVVKRLGF